MPRDAGDALRYGAVVASGWYPLEWYTALHAAARAAGAPPSFAREVGRVTTHRDLTTGVLKLVTRALTPAIMVSIGSRTFNRYYEVGHLEVTSPAAGRARLAWTGCVGFDRNLWEDVLGGCLGALEAAGAQDAHVAWTSGGSDGQDHATATARWR